MSVLDWWRKNVEPILRKITQADTVGQAMKPSPAPAPPDRQSPQEARKMLGDLLKPSPGTQKDIDAARPGNLAEFLGEFGIWALIALVGLIGLWGLLSPGGGVAIIERARR